MCFVDLPHSKGRQENWAANANLVYCGPGGKDAGTPRNGIPTRIGHNYRAGGTNGGPSESERKLEGRSENKNTSVASRIVLLGANAHLNKNLRQLSGHFFIVVHLRWADCQRHTIPRLVMVDVTGTIISAQHNECLATAGTAGTEFQATRAQRPESSCKL